VDPVPLELVELLLLGLVVRLVLLHPLLLLLGEVIVVVFQEQEEVLAAILLFRLERPGLVHLFLQRLQVHLALLPGHAHPDRGLALDVLRL